MFKKWLFNILIGIDQLANAILGGDPDMTISGRLGRNYKDSWMARFVDWIFLWQKRDGSESHVENAAYWERDEGSDAVIALSKKYENDKKSKA